MIISRWLQHLQRYFFPGQRRSIRNTARRLPANRQTQLRLEQLEDRLTPSPTLSLTSGSIAPNLALGTAQVGLTAQVSNPGGTVNTGVVTFSLDGVTAQSNVTNGMASTQLSVPIGAVLNGFTVGLSYTDTTIPNSNGTMLVSTSIWNALLPANITFNFNNNVQQVQFTLANQPIFSADYSLSNGLLSQIDFGSSSLSVNYVQTGNSIVAAVGNVPWGMILYDPSGNLVGYASVGPSANGNLVWFIRDINNDVVAEFPYYG